MCAWTHTADGKPISKNFQDRADYMVSGTAKIDITKEHFRIQDSVSDPTAHSVVMATDKLEDNVPLTDQRGGPVTQLQLDDAVASVEAYLEYVDNNIVHNDGINGEEWISAQFFFYDKDANPAAETDDEAVEKELAQPVSISVGRTAAEECEWLWKNAPVQFEEECKEFGCTPEEMIALAEEDPEAYYKYRNAYGYGDEEFGCFTCEAEVIDTPVNNIKDVTKLDNEGLGVARTDTATGERLAAVEAGELGVLSRDTNDYEASITLRSPNLFDTTVLGLHEPEVHVHSKVGTSQVQRYFTFPTNGGVLSTYQKPEWSLITTMTTSEVTGLDLTGKTELLVCGTIESGTYETLTLQAWDGAPPSENELHGSTLFVMPDLTANNTYTCLARLNSNPVGFDGRVDYAHSVLSTAVYTDMHYDSFEIGGSDYTLDKYKTFQILSNEPIPVTGVAINLSIYAR